MVRNCDVSQRLSVFSELNLKVGQNKQEPRGVGHVIGIVLGMLPSYLSIRFCENVSFTGLQRWRLNSGMKSTNLLQSYRNPVARLHVCFLRASYRVCATSQGRVCPRLVGVTTAEKHSGAVRVTNTTFRQKHCNAARCSLCFIGTDDQCWMMSHDDHVRYHLLYKYNANVTGLN